MADTSKPQEKQKQKKKKRRGGFVPLRPWECIDQENDKHYGRFSNQLVQHEKFKALSKSARYLYMMMSIACAGERRFQFSIPHAAQYGIGKLAFLRNRDELITKGFLRIVKNGKIDKTPSVYEWCWEWKKEGE